MDRQVISGVCGTWVVGGAQNHTGTQSPGNWSPCLPYRAECTASTLSDPTSPAPAEATFTPAVAVPPEAAVAATTAPGKASPAPAALPVAPVLSGVVPTGPVAAVTTAAPSTCTAAILGTATKDR